VADKKGVAEKKESNATNVQGKLKKQHQDSKPPALKMVKPHNYL